MKNTYSRRISGRGAVALVVAVLLWGLAPAFAVEKLIVKDGSSNTVFEVHDDGTTGIGTATPAVQLHVKRTDGTAQLRVEEAIGSVAVRNLLQLENNGPVQFTLLNSGTGDTWKFATNNSNDFKINYVDGSGAKLLLTQSGNLTIQGTLSEGSSRDLKEEFSAVDPEMVLAKVVDLPISTWTYKQTPHEVRHMGPMAEDFHEAFGLGATDKAITAIDRDGVAFAAIQGLNKKLDAKDRELAELRTELRELREAMATFMNKEGIATR